jgi:hypothetical protein
MFPLPATAAPLLSPWSSASWLRLRQSSASNGVVMSLLLTFASRFHLVVRRFTGLDNLAGK